MAMNLIQTSDRIFVAGASGMAGSAIVRALKRNGYGDSAKGGSLLTPNRQELNLLNDGEVSQWMNQRKPDVVVLAAATVGGIEANRSRPADFILQNLRIETQVIEASWRAGAGVTIFRRQLYLQFSLNQLKRGSSYRRSRAHQCLVCGSKDSRYKTWGSAAIQHGFDAISLMPTNLYRPGDNYHPSGSGNSGPDSKIPRGKEGGAAVKCGTGTPLGISPCR